MIAQPVSILIHNVLSRPKPVFPAIWVIPLALAISPSVAVITMQPGISRTSVLLSPSGIGRKTLAFRRRLQYACGMEHYRKSSHTVYDIKYRIVWITKYRKPVLRADIAQRVRELIREICRVNDVEIIKGHISRDHVHIFVSVPPHLSISHLVQTIKGKTSS